MKQIYNLLQTIEDDKKLILELEETYIKKLNTLKSVLAAHEDALVRLTTTPKLTLPENMETFAKGFNTLEESRTKRENRLQKRQRITQDNWKELGIEVGDTVEIVVSGDEDFADNSKCLVDLIDLNSTYSFLKLIDHENYFRDWYCYNRDNQGKDELYLIKQTA